MSGMVGQDQYFNWYASLFVIKNVRTSSSTPRQKTVSRTQSCFCFGLKEGRKGSKIGELYISHYESRLETMRA